MATILTAYYRHKPGGLCLRLARAIESLVDEGHQVHFVCVVPLPIRGVHFHRLWWPERSGTHGALFWLWVHSAMPWMLLWVGLRYRCTAAFSFSINYGAMMLPLRALKRIRYTLFLRADSVRNNRIKGVPAVLLILEHVVEAASIWRARVVGVTRDLIEDVVTRHPHVKVRCARVLPNDVPNTGLRAANYCGGNLNIGYVGVVEPRKNPTFVLDVLKQLVGVPVQLFVFGNGPSYADMVESARDFIQLGRVQFCGWQHAPNIWPRIHMLLHPALHEGASNSVLEALGSGVMVLASDIAEQREWLPQIHLLAVDDAAAWANRIRQLIGSEEERSRLLQSGRSVVKSLSFDWDAAVSRLILVADDGFDGISNEFLKDE